MRNKPSATRRALATVGLVLTLASCTPQEIAAWNQHLAEETARQAETPQAAVHRAFAERGAGPDLQAAAWRVAAGPASCGDNGESGGNPQAVNGRHVGLFQLSTVHRDRAARLGFTWNQVATGAYANASVAADLQLEQGWRPWACRP